MYETLAGYIATSLSPVDGVATVLGVGDLVDKYPLKEVYRRLTVIKSKLKSILRTESTTSGVIRFGTVPRSSITRKSRQRR